MYCCFTAFPHRPPPPTPLSNSSFWRMSSSIAYRCRSTPRVATCFHLAIKYKFVAAKMVLRPCNNMTIPRRKTHWYNHNQDRSYIYEIIGHLTLFSDRTDKGVKLTTHPQLASRLRMGGVTPLLPTVSLHGVDRGNFSVFTFFSHINLLAPELFF